jgi:hypothetical protein
LQVDGADGGVCLIDDDNTVEIVVEEADFALELHPYFEIGDFVFVTFDIFCDQHEIFLLRVDEIVDDFASCFGDLNIEGCFALHRSFLGESDEGVDCIANVDVDSNVAL